MAVKKTEDRFVTKIVFFRLILSGALVAVALAETLGLSNSVSSQLVAGSAGAVAVAALKISHFI